jgi:hypothetical protein
MYYLIKNVVYAHVLSPFIRATRFYKYLPVITYNRYINYITWVYVILVP